jgi:hypothetical protein
MEICHPGAEISRPKMEIWALDDGNLEPCYARVRALTSEPGWASRDGKFPLVRQVAHPRVDHAAYTARSRTITWGIGVARPRLQKVRGMIRRMSQQGSKKKMGRPSKGDRVVTWVRLPRSVRDQAEEIAAQRGWPVSDVVAELVEVGLDHAVPAALPAQEELPLNKAS